MYLGTEMGSSHSTYLDKNCAPDLFPIAVWPPDAINVSTNIKTITQCYPYAA